MESASTIDNGVKLIHLFHYLSDEQREVFFVNYYGTKMIKTIANELNQPEEMDLERIARHMAVPPPGKWNIIDVELNVLTKRTESESLKKTNSSKKEDYTTRQITDTANKPYVCT